MSQTTSSKRERFEVLLDPHRDVLRGYVHRLVGHPSDAEDLVQDILLKAFERLESLRADDAFRTWLFQIATRTSIDLLRKQNRWRPFSQSYAEQECAEVPALRKEVVATTSDPEFEFDVREHVAFCFTCVGRSLEPNQQVAIILREMLRFTNQEAADILGITEPTLRHHLSDGRRAMQETYEGLCALVNKKGICHQCSGFRNATAVERRGPALPVLQDDGWADRVEIAAQTHFVDGVSQPLHDLLFHRINRLERAAS